MFKKQRTYAPYGVISIASSMPAGGTMRQGSIEIDGSVKFALVTFTSETGDTEQQLVPVPFRKEIYPHEGWIVGIVAQKTKVTRPDPGRVNGIETLDDGRSGLMHVAIRVNGRVLSEGQTSQAFGIAKAAAKVE